MINTKNKTVALPAQLKLEALQLQQSAECPLMMVHANITIPYSSTFNIDWTMEAVSTSRVDLAFSLGDLPSDGSMKWFVQGDKLKQLLLFPVLPPECTYFHLEEFMPIPFISNIVERNEQEVYHLDLFLKD